MPSLREHLSHYQIHLALVPEEKQIDATVRLSFPARTGGTDSATPYLHRQLELRSVSGDGLLGYRFDTENRSPVPYMPEAGTLELRFADSLEEGQRVSLIFEYGGRISAWPEWSANAVARGCKCP